MKMCLNHCGRATSRNEDFCSEYCAMTYADDHGIPWFPTTERGNGEFEDAYLEERPYEA